MFDRRLEHWFQLELGLKSRISNLESWSESESESELDGLQTARACSYSYSGCCSCSCCRVHQSRVAVLPHLLDEFDLFADHLKTYLLEHNEL